MKTLLLATLVMLSAAEAQAQTYLGQSRSYILQKDKACLLNENTPGKLAFTCNGFAEQYVFDTTGICRGVACELSAANATHLLSILNEEGFNKESDNAFAAVYSNRQLTYMFIKALSDNLVVPKVIVIITPY